LIWTLLHKCTAHIVSSAPRVKNKRASKYNLTFAKKWISFGFYQSTNSAIFEKETIDQHKSIKNEEKDRKRPPYINV